MASAFRALRLAQRAPIARQMPVSRIASALPRTYATATIREATPDKPVEQAEQASEDLSDPNMNGNYPDPSKTSALPLKRQFRDPRGEWWDPQERRNYGEPVHEDNDILGIFTTESYTHITPGWGLVLIGTFVTAFCGMLTVVSTYYPDRPSAPREFPDGLEAELGGPRALRARKAGDA